MENIIYDLAIIGAGPAGLTAAIYASRANLKVIVLEKENVGSLLMAHKVDNYPGFENGATGVEIYEKMKKQAKRFGTEIVNGIFLDIDISQKPRLIKTNKKSIAAKTVIIATGVTKLGNKKYPGEEEFLGRGISYCATCDGAFFRNMKVSLFGNGEEVAEEALFLTRFASEIYIFSEEEFGCSKELFDRLNTENKIIIKENRHIKEITGTEFVEKVIVENKKENIIEEYEVSAAFMYLGTKNNFEMYSIFADVDEKGYIITDESMKTLEEGIFAAGDVREKNVRQVTTAVADGTIAALEAIKYINSNKA